MRTAKSYLETLLARLARMRRHEGVIPNTHGEPVNGDSRFDVPRFDLNCPRAQSNSSRTTRGC